MKFFFSLIFFSSSIEIIEDSISNEEYILVTDKSTRLNA